LLKIGDEIEFRLTGDEGQRILTKITNLSVFPSFSALFAAFPPHEYGSLRQDEYTKMYEIYSPEKERVFGALAIRIRFLHELRRDSFSLDLV
jgi:ASC-1-like (ASCH) protein